MGRDAFDRVRDQIYFKEVGRRGSPPYQRRKRNLSGTLVRKLAIEAEVCTLVLVETLEQIKARVEAAVPGARLEVVRNGSPSEQHSLLVDNEHAVAIAKFLRDDPALRLDYTSNVTGVDWLDSVVKESTKTKQVIDGVERLIEQTTERKVPG